MRPQVSAMLAVLVAMVLMTQSGASKRMLTLRDPRGKRCASCRKHLRNCGCGR